MKPTVPIKRHPALVPFSRDHHYGLLLVWKIREGLRTGVEAERISRYLYFFYEKDLRGHFLEEEELLLSKLPEGDSLRRIIDDEHKKIHELAAAIQSNPVDASLLAGFASTLEAHIRFEERVFFNHFQQNVAPELLNELQALSPGVRTDIDTEWNDRFWEPGNSCTVPKRTDNPDV
jgi:hypothetical protein